MIRWGVAIILLSMGVAACGGGLGNIQMEDVDLSLRNAEEAVRMAQPAHVSPTAQATLAQAEQMLSRARQAKNEERGLDAIRLAESAASTAHLAGIQARQENLLKEQIAQIRQQNDELIRVTKSELESARTESQRAQRKTHQLDQELQNLRRERQHLQEAVLAKRQAEEQAQQASNTMRRLEQRLQAAETQLDQARTKQRHAEHRASQLIEQLDQQVKKAEREADRARQQANETERKASAMAGSYSNKIDKLERERNIAQAEANARRYVSQSKQQELDVDYSASIPGQAQAQLEAWNLAWATQDTERHLGFYASGANAEKTRIVKGKEQRTSLTSSVLFSDLRQMIQQRWNLTGHRAGLRGNKVVGSHQFSQPRAGTSLNTVWDRETHWQERNGTWQIVQEVWRIYEQVPAYERQLR